MCMTQPCFLDGPTVLLTRTRSRRGSTVRPTHACCDDGSTVSPRKRDCESWKRREILFGDLKLHWQPISAATLSDNSNELGGGFDRLDPHVTCLRDGSTVTNNAKFVFAHGSTVTESEFEVLAEG